MSIKGMKRRYIIFVLAVVAVAIRMGMDYAARAEKQAEAEQELSVVVSPAACMPIQETVEAIGTAFANESVALTANVSEIIRDIRFSDGQKVRKGAVIVMLDQEEEKAQLAALQAQMEEHQRELQRIEKLLGTRSIPQKEYDERLTKLEISKQDMDVLRARIEDRTVRAPFEGVLGLRRLSAGSLLQPGQIITTLDDIDHIKLDFSIPEPLLHQVKLGNTVTVTGAASGGKMFQGRIDAIDSRVDPETRSVVVRALLENPEHIIKPGMLMKVLLTKSPREALVIPEESILQRKDEHYVFVVGKDDKTVQERMVQVIQRKPGIVEVRDGILPGDEVIVRGTVRVKAGEKVSVSGVMPINAGTVLLDGATDVAL